MPLQTLCCVESGSLIPMQPETAARSLREHRQVPGWYWIDGSNREDIAPGAEST